MTNSSIENENLPGAIQHFEIALEHVEAGIKCTSTGRETGAWPVSVVRTLEGALDLLRTDLKEAQRREKRE